MADNQQSQGQQTPSQGSEAEPQSQASPDPVKALNERQKAAIDKAMQARARAEIEGAEVATEQAPKGAKGAAPASASTEASSGSAPDSANPSAERKAPQPRYDSDSFKNWVSNNPEAAAEIAASVFKVGSDFKTQFVKLENKARKNREREETSKKTLGAA